MGREETSTKLRVSKKENGKKERNLEGIKEDRPGEVDLPALE